jgi:ABC-2 type transport system ATP-binding protein
MSQQRRRPPARPGDTPAAPAAGAASAASATARAGGTARVRPSAPPRSPGALDAVGLTKRYGALEALAPLDLRIEAGEAVALVGHNGSGKTTLLRMVAGLLDPTEGTVTVHGADAGSPAARVALSYLSDTPVFYEDLSVWEHLEYVARLHGALDWEQRAADLLGELGIYERADDLPVTFSRGLKQKAQIAIGLVRPFALLCVDEPFVGLDASGKQALLALLDESRREGAALVVATHELGFVERVDRVIALRDGHLVHDGPPGDIDVLALVT